MRHVFLAGVSRKQAIAQCPWASKIVKVEGGYLAFESLSDYETWRKQR